MTPEEPHPLEGRLLKLPLPGLPAGWRDRVLFEAGRATGRRGRWPSGGLLLAGMAAGFISGSLLPTVFPVPGGSKVESLQTRTAPETQVVATSPDNVTPEDRLAWETRRRILVDGVESIPVSTWVGLVEKPVSLDALIEEANR